MKNRNAQVSSGFQYLFALIVGGIFFLFFVGFAYKFLGFSASLSAAELVASLDDEFAALSASDASEKTLRFSRTISFFVSEGQLLSGGQGRVLDHIVFSPLEIKGKEVVVATRSLELPYRVGNAFYLADGRTVYIFVFDSGQTEVAEVLQNSALAFPQTFPVMYISLQELQGNIDVLEDITAGYERMRFVFFTSSDAVLPVLGERFSSAEVLEVSSSVEDFSSGEVRYPSGERVVYIGYPLLFGAVLSEDAEAYQYAFLQVLEKLSRVTGVYVEKARFLAGWLPECAYVPVRAALSSFQGSFANIGEGSFSSFLVQRAALEEANKGFGGECPEIY